MRGRPENPGREHRIAVILNAHGQAAVLAVAERRAHRCRQAVADSKTAFRADVLVVLVEIPKAQRPAADELAIRYQ